MYLRSRRKTNFFCIISISLISTETQKRLLLIGVSAESQNWCLNRESKTSLVNWYFSRESETYLCTSDKASFLVTRSMTRVNVGLSLSYVKLLLSSWKTYTCNLNAWVINK